MSGLLIGLKYVSLKDVGQKYVSLKDVGLKYVSLKDVVVPPVWPDWAIYCTLGNFKKLWQQSFCPNCPHFRQFL